MTIVQQTGLITPNHVATWSTTGVIQDGGPVPTGRFVISGRGINFNTTADQPIAFPAYITAFRLANIVITNASASLTTAAGGFYPAAAKSGTPLVSAGQTYAALTTANGLMTATLASFGSGTRFSSSTLNSIAGLLNIWFALSTPQGAPVTADIYFIVDNLT